MAVGAEGFLASVTDPIMLFPIRTTVKREPANCFSYKATKNAKNRLPYPR